MNIKKILVIVVAILLIPAIFFAGFYTKGYYEKKQETAATKVAKQFVADIVNGNTSSAYTLTGKALQTGQKSSDFSSTMSGLNSKTPKYETAQVMRQGSQIFYVQRVTGLPATKTGSDAGNFYVALNQEGGSWKVTTVTVF